jgi:hypothetical protein
VITTSYIDDLVTLWTPVHPALLEVDQYQFIDAAKLIDNVSFFSTGDPLVRAVHRLRSG